MHFKVLCTILLGLFALQQSQGGNHGNGHGKHKKCMAVCYLKPNGKDGKVNGYVRFFQKQGDNTVLYTGMIGGLTPGYHGFHIHEFGNLTDDCASAGPHFNPHRLNHGGPADTQRHVGDLGNILADRNGNATFQQTDNVISLRNVTNGIIGHSCVVHQNPDDLGRGPPTSDTKTTGNSGARVACGTIIKICEPFHLISTTPKY